MLADVIDEVHVACLWQKPFGMLKIKFVQKIVIEIGNVL